MKKMTKWLSLLMAGLMLSATLLACESAYTGSDDDDDEEEEESSSKYEDLDPEEIEKALLKADRFTFTVESLSGGTTENTTYLQSYSKYGNLLKGVIKITSSAFDSQKEVYADLKNDLIYAQQDGAWTTHEEEVDLVDLLEGQMYSGLLLNSDNYLEFDPETKRYPLKEEAIRKEIGTGDLVSVEGYLSSKGSEYTFFFSITSANGIPQTCTVTVKFTADKITLPKVESTGNEGVAVPDVKD